MINGLIGKKLNMTTSFDEEKGLAIPVTVIELGPCKVIQVKTSKRDGYESVQIGFDEKKMTKLSLNCPHVPGRMELAGKKNNGARVYIDFAHTPDALKNVLSEAKLICKGELVVLFGCGGNRDKKKRPLMGRIAEKYSDIAIVTDDNPRYEDANKIRREIIKNSDKLINLINRKHAIKKSISLLKSKDVLIIAGKGHEKYQIIKGKKFPFDDVKIAKSFLKK